MLRTAACRLAALVEHNIARLLSGNKESYVLMDRTAAATDGLGGWEEN
jgi:hypothetical protein